MATTSENIISQINSLVFFKEFTFCKNDFKDLNTNQKLEFADNVVWLDDIFWVYQIKEKENATSDDKKWFENKILNKAVKQIKNTINYFSTYPEIEIENEKGHKLDITKAKEFEQKKLIIYSADSDFSKELRNIKFYDSRDIGLIHLFHYEDYFEMCKHLITPAEVDEYLSFRERFYTFAPESCDALPEQYFLGHFFETPDTNHFDARYVNNLIEYCVGDDDFDISGLIEHFNERMIYQNSKTEYYSTIKEFAKLNRAELIYFKKCLVAALKYADRKYFVKPIRVYFLRTDCAIIFVPLSDQFPNTWKNILQNLTIFHKYTSKAKKAIGIAIFKHKKSIDDFEMHWHYVEQDWKYDAELKQRCMEFEKSGIFRKSKFKCIENRYKF